MKCRRCRGCVLTDYGKSYCINCGDEQGYDAPVKVEQVIKTRWIHKPRGYWDEHRDEFLLDRIDIGHHAAMLKWGMPRASWAHHRQRWLEQGVIVFELRRRE